MSILDDGTFVSYGGQTGSSTAVQRLIAYSIAQEQIERYIGTFLVPTVATGVFVTPYPDNRIFFRESDLIAVHGVIGLHDNPTDGRTTRYTGTSFILSHENSVVAIHDVWSDCLPDRFEVVYEAGLANGVFTGSHSYMMALVALAQMYLQQLYNQLMPQGGAITSKELVSWSSMTHTETYAKGTNVDNFFGDTALAGTVANLLAPLRRYRTLKLP